MSMSDSESVLLDAPVGGISPRRIFLDIGPGTTRATMIAATEGAARFIASAPGEPGTFQDRARSALQWLATQCGYPVTPEMVDVAIIRGRPLKVGIVGRRGAADEEAIERAGRSGIAQVAEVPGTPPSKADKRPEWVRPLLDALMRGEYDALIIATQPGSLPTWAAQLLNGLHAVPAHRPRDVIVIASDVSLASVLPPGVSLFGHDASLPHHLSDALMAIRSRRIFGENAPPPSVMSSISALSAGLTFVAGALRETVVHMDVSAGTTVLIARTSGVDILVDADVDCAAGAVALLDRYGTEEIGRWLPFPIEEHALRQWAIRRISHPAALLVEANDRAIAAAFARTALTPLLAKAAMPIADAARCVIGPAALEWSLPEEAAYLVADVLRGVRFAHVAADADDLLPIIGALAAHDPESAHALLTNDLFSDVGGVLTRPESAQRKDAPVAAIIQDGGRAMRMPIAANAITRIPVPPTRSLRIIGRDGREETVQVAGQSGDLLVDTRTRPLSHRASPDSARGSVRERLKPALASEEEGND
jgi:hypothetical protein